MKHEDPRQEEQRGTVGAQQGIRQRGRMGVWRAVSWLRDDAGKGAWNPLVQLVRHARKAGVSVGSQGTLKHIK